MGGEIPQPVFFVASLVLVVGILLFLRGLMSYVRGAQVRSAEMRANGTTASEHHDGTFLVGLGGAVMATIGALALAMMINGRF
jgi:hypothetical protein